MLSSEFFNLGMQVALEEASKAGARGEVPVGAVIALLPKVDNSKQALEIVARAGNRVEELRDAAAHAEMLAMRQAGERLGTWRLSDCALFVTLEPCSMCAGALRNFRVGALVFGAVDPRLGAAGSLYDLTLDTRLGPVPRVVSGIEEQQCAALLSEFFKKLRD